MGQELERKIEQAEEGGDALTNEVYFTESSVIKKYRRFPLTSFFMVLVELPQLKIRYINRETRMGNEVRMKREVRKAGLEAPNILTKGETMIEFEKVSGVSGHEYLNSCGGEEAYDLGVSLNRFFGRLHENGSSLRDSRLSNFQVDDEIYSLDHEYCCFDAGRWSKFLDQVSVVSSARQTERYEEFSDGFDVGLSSSLLSVFASLVHASLMEKSLVRTKRVFRSLG